MNNEPPTLFDALTPDPDDLHRSTDPDTSRRGAQSALVRAGSQAARLLQVYAAQITRHDLTDDEAADLAGLLSKPGCCWWHRCSDLRDRGLIAPTGIRTSAHTGEERMTCKITDAGWSLANDLKWKEIRK